MVSVPRNLLILCDLEKNKMYRKTYSITAGDMDINYRMTPNAALLYFQDCYASYLGSRYLGTFDLVKENKIWVITDFDLTFVDKRAMWADKISVSIRFSEIGLVRAYVSYELARVDTGKVFAKGDSCWVVLDCVSKRPVNVTEILARAEATDQGIRHRGKKYPVIEDGMLVRQEIHDVNCSDLDFNGHVCNRSYLSMAMTTMPVEFIRISNPKYVHIRFQKESFIDDVLTISVYNHPTDGNTIFHEIRNSRDDIICSVYSEWETDEQDLSQDVAELIARD